MPVTDSGRKVMKEMMRRYGSKKGKEVFYSSVNKGKKGTDKWHASKGNNYTESLKG